MKGNNGYGRRRILIRRITTIITFFASLWFFIFIINNTLLLLNSNNNNNSNNSTSSGGVAASGGDGSHNNNNNKNDHRFVSFQERLNMKRKQYPNMVRRRRDGEDEDEDEDEEDRGFAAAPDDDEQRHSTASRRNPLRRAFDTASNALRDMMVMTTTTGGNNNHHHYHYTGGSNGEMIPPGMERQQHQQQQQERHKPSKTALQIKRDVLDAKAHLVNIDIDHERFQQSLQQQQQQENNEDFVYSGIYGTFCQLNWQLHKHDPAATPMFRDLVANSPDCKSPSGEMDQPAAVKIDLYSLVQEVRKYDHWLEQKRNDPSRPQSPFHRHHHDDDENHNHNHHHNDDDDNRIVPKVLNITSFIFHESRCGSTLVANIFAAMRPKRHRVYSESQPPITILNNLCGEDYQYCSMNVVAHILRDVIYIMSRTNDPYETNVFYKIQSIGTRNIAAYQIAFPTTPYMFIYRNPIEVMMSHVGDDVIQRIPGGSIKNANCVRPQRRSSSGGRMIQSVVAKYSKTNNGQHHNNIKQLSAYDYCAAHLATLTESALAAMEEEEQQQQQEEDDEMNETQQQQQYYYYGIPVNYNELPDRLWNEIFIQPPYNHYFDNIITDEDISNMKQISTVYSKGRGNKSGMKFISDSEQKTNMANTYIQSAAKQYLFTSYELLEQKKDELKKRKRNNQQQLQQQQQQEEQEEKIARIL